MEIYIVRHGKALEGYIDESRELSEKGKKQAKRAGKCLKNSNIDISEIFSSHLKRAVQTAKIIAKELNFKSEIKTTELLNPLSNPDEILDHLQYKSREDKDKFLLVGHQPFLGRMIAVFIKSDEECVDLKKGCLCKIEIKNRKFEKLKHII